MVRAAGGGERASAGQDRKKRAPALPLPPLTTVPVSRPARNPTQQKERKTQKATMTSHRFPCSLALLLLLLPSLAAAAALAPAPPAAVPAPAPLLPLAPPQPQQKRCCARPNVPR
jgi:hypothetical protein